MVGTSSDGRRRGCRWRGVGPISLFKSGGPSCAMYNGVGEGVFKKSTWKGRGAKNGGQWQQGYGVNEQEGRRYGDVDVGPEYARGRGPVLRVSWQMRRLLRTDRQLGYGTASFPQRCSYPSGERQRGLALRDVAAAGLQYVGSRPCVSAPALSIQVSVSRSSVSEAPFGHGASASASAATSASVAASRRTVWAPPASPAILCDSLPLLFAPCHAPQLGPLISHTHCFHARTLPGTQPIARRSTARAKPDAPPSCQVAAVRSAASAGCGGGGEAIGWCHA